MDFLRRHVSLRAAVAVFVLAVVLTLVLISVYSGNRSIYVSPFEELGITSPDGEYQLWVNTYPEGAKCDLEGVSYGRTPVGADDLQPGTLSVSLRMAGFLAFDSSIVIDPGESVTLEPIVLRKSIVLRSAPSEAEVLINGRGFGCQTPCELEWPSCDTFNVTYLLDGLKPIGISTIDPLAGSAIVPNGGCWLISEDSNRTGYSINGCFLRDVTINTLPTDAAIVAVDNDSLVGASGMPLTLPCGERVYYLVKQGFNDREIRLEVTGESPGSYDFELERNLLVSAHEVGRSPDVDIRAAIPKMDRGVTVTFLSDTTPAVLTLPGVEHRIYLTATGYLDTSVIISAAQTSVNVGMYRIDGTIPDTGPPILDPHSDEGRVEFFVYDEDSKEPIAEAEVIAEIRSEDRRVLLGTTDKHGVLARYLRPGKYKFEFHAEGYESEDKKHRVKAGETRRFEIELEKR